MGCCIVIPAYEPGEAVIPYVKELLYREMGPVLVVDDGSGPHYASIFERLEQMEGCTVLRHAANRGKGAALKTAIGWYLEHLSDLDGIITVDCDGQHAQEDVQAVRAALSVQHDALVLGVRDFRSAHTPQRSLLGNRAASLVLRGLYGIQLKDTQTGLRGLPNHLLPALHTLEGERFEYEFNMLLLARNMGTTLVQVPIRTIYYHGNRGSHFRAMADTLRILAVLTQTAPQREENRI